MIQGPVGPVGPRLPQPLKNQLLRRGISRRAQATPHFSAASFPQHTGILGPLPGIYHGVGGLLHGNLPSGSQLLDAATFLPSGHSHF
jgi:hypothetical protein